MRALIVFLALAVAVVICMTFVALFAGINVGSTVLLIIGLGVFMVGALFAAIAALGPKSPPTPLLTPTIAGITAVFLTSVALIAGSTHLGNAHRSAMRAGEPEKVAAPEPNIATSAPKAPEPAPEPMQFPGVTIEPAGPLPGGPALAMPDGTPPPAPMADPQAPNGEPSAVEPAEAPEPMAPQSDIADAVTDTPPPMAGPQAPLAESSAIEPVEAPAPMAPQTGFAGEDSVVGPAAPEAPTADTPPQPAPATADSSASPAVTPIPIPPPRPTRLVLSEQPFDTTPPPSPPGSTNPPAATGRTAASPPLPRSRPCGAGGPPCP